MADGNYEKFNLILNQLIKKFKGIVPYKALKQILMNQGLDNLFIQISLGKLHSRDIFYYGYNEHQETVLKFYKNHLPATIGYIKIEGGQFE